MSKMTFSEQTVVHVEVRGEPHPKGFPYLPIDDENLIGRFLDWCRANEIYPATRAGMTGPGINVAFYSPEDARRIREWLVAHGVTEVEPR